MGNNTNLPYQWYHDKAVLSKMRKLLQAQDSDLISEAECLRLMQRAIFAARRAAHRAEDAEGTAKEKPD